MAQDIIYKGNIIYQTPEEQKIFREEVRKVKDVEGDIVEVGVYQGGTAQIIREELPDKTIYLFDTFEGLAGGIHECEAKSFKLGDCATNESFVTNVFKNDPKVIITKGEFPKTADIIKDKKFAFVHLDVDIYYPTKEGLEFLYPRVVPGGIMIVHDYPVHPGVRLAVDEWIKDKLDQTKQYGNRQFIIYKK